MSPKLPLRALAPCTAAILFALPAFAAEERRQADAHVHGHGMFTIAMDGKTLEMVLKVPGADIVGFEHEAKTDADKAAMKNAISQLQNPEKVFALPAAAECKIDKAEAHTGDEHEHEHEDEHEADHKDDHKAEHKDEHKDEHKAEHDHEGEEHHMEFHGHYNLTCAKPEALSSITLNVFASFPSLKEVAVQAITAKGQMKAEATPQQPEIRF